MTAFLWRPRVRKTVQTIFWAMTATATVALFIAGIHYTLRILGAPYC